MIDKQEILEFSREFSLRPDVVEKDYALGWLLYGIGQHPALKKSWIFKGGTCLKKCYFETYRFSEDLDFTLLDGDHLSADFLRNAFEEIAAQIYEQSGLELPQATFSFEIFQNQRGNPAGQGRIGYRGPIAPPATLPRIKLDLAHDERVIMEPAPRPVHHGYSDKPAEGMEILCYPFPEIFAEKLRALADRERPRDLYDVFHLYHHDEMRPDQSTLQKLVHEKCSFKNIPFPSLALLEREPARSEIEADWSSMLAHQLPALPPFQDFWNELKQIFSWIGGAAPLQVLERAPLESGEDPNWTPPPAAQAWHMQIPLEVIRFAGANRLCVNLGYDGTQRLIEPYSLRRTQEGNLLLHSVRVDNREHRAYRVDKIQSAEVTKQSFTPVYAIELSQTYK